ncbi:MAG: methylmalonyl-CoA mutase [Planctomycetes bacterium]|nr:methylmalonyl-CoA mutase [Planctomycetota bacterium]
MSQPARAGARWFDEVWTPAARGHPERSPRFLTTSGLELAPCYFPAEAPAPTEAEGPGEFPYTRGVHPTMYRGRLWTMRQYAGFGSAQETNRRFRMLLDAGQTGLSVAFDLPTQIGYDSDHPLADGEVGRVGVPISCLEDMEALLDGLPLERISTSMTINSSAMVMLAFYVAVARRRGIPPGRLAGTLQNDILKEFIARGTWRFPVGPSMRLVTDVIAWCSEHAPRWNPVSVSGYHIREAGATAVQELAYTLADGLAYVEAALGRGLDLEGFAGRLSFFFNAHNHLFEEVAKFRAARRLWARLLRERHGAPDSACKLRFHVQSAGSTLAGQQPELNVVRVALQALSAVLGGCQSLHTNAWDEALGLPTEESATLALRTQQVLAHESGVADVADPLGGSPYVEALTDALETGARECLARIQAMGGMVRAIQEGYPQREIHDSAWRHQREVESGARVVVGVNRWRTGEGPRPGVFRVDQAVQGRRAEALRSARARRDPARVAALVARLEAAAREAGENLVPHVLEGVEAGLTLGEVMETLAGVFGEHDGAGASRG